MLANVACTGNEETLLECNRNSYSILDCHGYELAGVVCEGINSFVKFELLFKCVCRIMC